MYMSVHKYTSVLKELAFSFHYVGHGGSNSSYQAQTQVINLGSKFIHVLSHLFITLLVFYSSS